MTPAHRGGRVGPPSMLTALVIVALAVVLLLVVPARSIPSAPTLPSVPGFEAPSTRTAPTPAGDAPGR